MLESMQSWREAALQQFRATGLPHNRQEDWKYTDVEDIHTALGRDWREPAAVDPAMQEVPAHAVIEELDGYRIVIHRGRIHPGSDALPDGVELTCWSAMDEAGAIERLPRVDPQARLFSAFEALNAARMQDGLCIRIAAGVMLPHPLYVVHVHDADTPSHVRHRVQLEEGAQAAVIVHDVAAAEGKACLRSSHWQLDLASRSQLRFTRVQELADTDWQMAQLRVTQQQGSVLEAHAVELGGAKVRMDAVVELLGEGAFCRCNGLFLIYGHQHVDHHVHISHVAAHCRSRQAYRSVLGGHAHGVYNGAVHVHAGASGSDAEQHSDNLLLSRYAEIDTKPELEIDHDNVKCAHGATVGQLDADQWFYLRSRGLSEAMSRDVLVFAFADTQLAQLPHAAVRRYVERVAFDKLPHSETIAGMLL